MEDDGERLDVLVKLGRVRHPAEGKEEAAVAEPGFLGGPARPLRRVITFAGRQGAQATAVFSC